MKFAWICFNGGALNRADSSSIGSSVSTRAPMVEMLTKNGHKVLWFGGRKDSHRTDGVQKRVIPQYDLLKEIAAIFSGVPDDRTFPGDDNVSKSRYRVAHTVDRVRKRVVLPEVDAAWVDFMDVGLPNIACTLALMVEYLRQGIPVFLFDTDLRFRYRKDLGLTGGRSNKYRFSYERFLSKKQADWLVDTVVLHQIRKIPPDPHFQRLETFLPVYDHRRERSIKDQPKWDVTYVGNDYMRRPWAEKWYGRGRIKGKVRIIGKWDPYYWEQSPLANLRLYPPIRPDQVESRLNNSLATVHLAPPHYAQLGHITTRTREATAAGCVIITPSDMKDAKAFTDSMCIVDNHRQLNDVLESIRLDRRIRQEVVEVQRRKARKTSGLKKSYRRLMEMVDRYS